MLDRPEKRDELLSDLLHWFAATKAELPAEKNAAYDPDAQPQNPQRGRRRNRQQ